MATDGVRISCGNGPNGDMYMNYMDYTDDAGMIMFTEDQAMRMDAALAVSRTGILASDGLVPVAGGMPMSDLWMKDTGDDIGDEPNASPSPMYLSDDIWVRNAADGLANQDHQNPRGEQANFVYVRVRNRGCAGAASQSGTLKLYWAKASSSLAWPAPWDGSVTSPALMGGLIGSQSVTVGGGSCRSQNFPGPRPTPPTMPLRRRQGPLLPAGADRDGSRCAVRHDLPGNRQSLRQRAAEQQHRLEEHQHR